MKELPSMRRFIDVGAHWGNHSIFALESGKFTSALCIEGSPTNFHVLESNTRYRRTRNLNVCCWDEEVTGIMELDERNKNNSGMWRFKPNPAGPVHAVTLDSILAKETGFDPPSMIKIDVEGSEQRVIAGAINTINAHSPIIAAEVVGETDLGQFNALMHDLGYVYDRLLNNSTPTHIFTAT